MFLFIYDFFPDKIILGSTCWSKVSCSISIDIGQILLRVYFLNLTVIFLGNAKTLRKIMWTFQKVVIGHHSKNLLSTIEVCCFGYQSNQIQFNRKHAEIWIKYNFLFK